MTSKVLDKVIRNHLVDVINADCNHTNRRPKVFFPSNCPSNLARNKREAKIPGADQQSKTQRS